MSILPGSRVLDLGSGRGATSVFLAKELGVEVWAADLWISPAVVEPMLRDLGLSAQVHPVQADARALPFEDGFFVVIVRINCWVYFGTSTLIIPGQLRVLCSRRQLGMSPPPMAPPL